MLGTVPAPGAKPPELADTPTWVRTRECRDPPIISP